MYFCSFLTFVDYLNYPAKSLKNIKETFALSSFHRHSSRWNQEGKKFSSWETSTNKNRGAVVNRALEKRGLSAKRDFPTLQQIYKIKGCYE